MRSVLPILLIFVAAFSAKAQSTGTATTAATNTAAKLTATAHILHVFAENGEKFFLIVNGEKQNDKPLARVTVKDLDQEYYRGKIIFDDERLGEMNVNFQMAGVDPGFNDVTYIIKKKMKKGKPVFRLWPGSWKKIGEAPATSSTDAQALEPAQEPTVNPPAVQPLPKTTTQVTTAQSTQSTHDIRNEATQPVANACGAALPDASFQDMLTSVTSVNFEDVKLQTANVIVSGNCLTTGQIKQIIQKFNFEESRLSFAKSAYSRCLDKQNYLQVENEFQFTSSKTALNQFISGQKK